MNASIIILTKNAGENFKELLERIFSQEFNGTYEVLVIDSGSTDNTLNTAKEFPVKATQIKPEDFHHGKTRNLGAELCRGRILVYITQDALPLNNNWLQKLVDNLKDSNVAMVCGRQIPWPAMKPPEKGFYFYSFPEYKIVLTLDSWRKSADRRRDAMFISNVNSAISKDVWQRFRFSEDVIMAEDKEFAKRALFAGWSIAYEPEAAVYHSHDLSLWAVFRRYLDYGASLNQGVDELLRSDKGIFKVSLQSLALQIRYLRDNGYSRSLPYAIFYDGSKFLGQMLGEFKGKLTAQKLKRHSL
jgi:rhamnosyltransferase